MPGEEKKTNKGEERLDEQDVRNIATQVKALIDQGKEKELVSDQLTAVNRKIGETSAGLEELKKLFCTPDGKACFLTEAQLNTYMEQQGKKIEAIAGTLSEVVERINKQPPAPELPKGVEVLEPMTEEKRKTLTEEQNRVRDEKVAQNDRILHQTSNDRFRQMDEVDRGNIVAKPDMRQRFAKTLSNEEIKEAMLIGCKGDQCKVLRTKLEAEEGLKIYERNKEGRFEPVDQEKKKDFFTP